MKKIYFLIIVSFCLQGYSQTPITATIEYQGYDESQAYFGEGEYQIFLDNVDGILDKPVILIDGFDPGDSRDIASLYGLMDFDGGNLADILRDEGFDLVALNAPQYSTDGKDIDGGADYIQRNAMVLVELIDLINNQKVGDEDLVIIGPSMGGLIARYGLTYMEQNTMDPETRLYISFDSPHLGANVPMGVQYLLSYFAYGQDNADAQLAVESLLNSPAAKEMIIDHYSAHLAAGSEFEQDPNLLLPDGAPGFREAFQAELDNLGFPQNVRNVCMINGSGTGIMTGTPGMLILDTTLDLGNSITADLTLYFTPLADESNTVTDFTAYFIGIPVDGYSADSQSFSYTSGLDSTPGGMSSMGEFFDDLEQEEYSFIPSFSALAIESENDWYALPNIADSPFVNTYMPNENENHVTLTQGNVDFALEEIRQEILGVLENDFSIKYILTKNPVSEQIVLKLNDAHNYYNVEISLYNISGQLVVSEKLQNPTQEISINQSLNSGVYILNIIDSETSYNVKIVVR